MRFCTTNKGGNILKHPWTAFILNFFPGLGHIYLHRTVRGFIYLMLTFGSVIGGLGLYFLSNAEGFMVIGVGFGLLIYGISFIDMIATLVSGNYKTSSMGDMPHHSLSGEQLSERSMNMEGSEIPSIQTDNTERFYTIVLSFIPGLGHFQIGLMHRGINFLMLFFGCLTLIAFITLVTGEEGFLVLLGVLPVIWLYNLFDAIQLLQRKQKGEELKDAGLLEDWERHREVGRKSTMIATLLALFPGAGHMYLGLQKRGLQLMAGFLFSIYILDVLHLSLFLFIIPLIWFFSFFDVLQKINQYMRDETVKDEPVVVWLLHHQRWIGIGLIALGLFYLADRVLIQALDNLLPAIDLTRWFKQHFQTTFVSLLLIGGGVWLLWSGKRSGKEK